jgi:hypothetical protein
MSSRSLLIPISPAVSSYHQHEQVLLSNPVPLRVQAASLVALELHPKLAETKKLLTQFEPFTMLQILHIIIIFFHDICQSKTSIHRQSLGVITSTVGLVSTFEHTSLVLVLGTSKTLHILLYHGKFNILESNN